ncbi:hypothetical protein GCM10027280_03730 [Micromonospora polyrhachis]|uniref:Uncharacterized protein n=1 Tax=Micromonospora polyrhachis TaxID=1282883 RepID=A0A7W7SM72_9ACTN|nr:hypothetical protein [Micromonospora polyrhachis]MBB4957328.1 hypothetical protein [Micromonospora polyrhachis]
MATTNPGPPPQTSLGRPQDKRAEPVWSCALAEWIRGDDLPHPTYNDHTKYRLSDSDVR